MNLLIRNGTFSLLILKTLIPVLDIDINHLKTKKGKFSKFVTLSLVFSSFEMRIV